MDNKGDFCPGLHRDLKNERRVASNIGWKHREYAHRCCGIVN